METKTHLHGDRDQPLLRVGAGHFRAPEPHSTSDPEFQAKQKAWKTNSRFESPNQTELTPSRTCEPSPSFSVLQRFRGLYSMPSATQLLSGKNSGVPGASAVHQ